MITIDGPLMFTEPLLMEVLAGAGSDAREDDLRRLLLRFGLAHFDALTVSTPRREFIVGVDKSVSPLAEWSTA